MAQDRPIDVAAEAARGRYATRVRDIPIAGWRDILRRVVERLEAHSMSLIAGGVAFFLVLSIFPALAAIVALYGLLADPSQLGAQLTSFAGVLPSEVLSLLETHYTRFANQGSTRLGIAFIAGLAITLWFAHAGLKSLFVALNVVYEEREKRSFIRFNLDALAASAALLVVLLLLVGTTVVTSILFDRLGMGDAVGWAIAILRWPIFLVAATAGFVIVYRIGPSRRPPRWRWLGWGSAFTAVAWLAVSGGYSLYLAWFANYNVTYGSLGAVIGFMLWVYLSVFVLLVGAEINAEIEHQLAVDTTIGPGRPRGERGAKKADTIAPPPAARGRETGERRRGTGARADR